MVVNCEEVWREISNYLEGDIEPGLRLAMEEHIRGCQRCTAVLEGTRNVVQLYGDERMLEVPLGFSQRLQHRLEENMPRSRRGFLGWMVAAAAAVLSPVVLRWAGPPSSAILNSARSTPNLEPVFLRTCWLWFQQVERYFTCADAHSFMTKHTFRQSRPGRRCEKGTRLASAA